jgi:hypothetical protein
LKTALLFLCLAGLAAAVFPADSLAELLAKGKSEAQSGHPNLALYYLNQAQRLDPSNSEVCQWMGYAYEKRGEPERALGCYVEALDRKPGDAYAARAVKRLQPKAAEAAAKALAEPPQREIKLEFPAKSAVPLPKGLGAWCYQSASLNAKTINDYNRTAPRDQRIAYAFVEGGGIDFALGKAKAHLDFAEARALAGLLEGPVMVMLIVDGLSHGASKVGSQEWDRVAAEIGQAVEAEGALSGVQFDVEPHLPDLHYLYGFTKKHSSKLVSAAVGQWQPETFKYCDLTVLMAYDIDADPRVFASKDRSLTRRFMADARRMDGKALIGVPCIATHTEFETKATAQNAPRSTGTGNRMQDYTEAAIAALKGSLVSGDPAFLGLSIWALHPQNGLHGSHDPYWYFPTQISEPIWALLRLPVLP